MNTDTSLILQFNLTVSQATLLKLCFKLNLRGLGIAKKAKLVAALEDALMNSKQAGFFDDKQPLSKVIEAADSLGFDRLMKLKKVSCDLLRV